MADHFEFGWVLVYVFAFGISDYLVKNYIKNDYEYIIYYVFIGIIGLFLIYGFKSNYVNL